MQTGIEAGKATESARAELESLRRRAAQLEASIAAESAPRVAAAPASPVAHIEHSQEAARRSVGEQWQQAVAKPSPAEAPRVASHPDAITLKLTPEEHDERMGEFIYVLQESGVAKAIAAAEATGNPHLIDDFHRVLVEWVYEGLPAKGADKDPYKVPLSLVLYEVTLPQAGADAEKSSDPTRALREFISLMEQFYRGMLQMDAKHGEYFSFEIANPAGSAHTSVYLAVPRARKAMFEKQLMSLYPAARVVERHDDYSAFASGSQVAAATATQAERHIYSLRTFDAFPNDPLDSLLNAFSKLDEAGEGAAVQFVVSPHDKGLLKRYRHALQSVHSGIDLHYATHVPMGVSRIFHEVSSAFSTPKKQDDDKRLRPDDPRLKNIESKVSSPILLTDIRIVASATTTARAKEILQDIEAPFQQFADTAGNRLQFKEVPSRKIGAFAHTFSYRMLNENAALPLSAMELATLAHLPRSEAREFAPELRQDKSQAAAPPIGLPKGGVLLGINRFRNTETPVYMQAEDRLRHLYVIGQTGAGKSTLLKNIIIQDIKSGAGVCFIDPHGSDVLEVLSAVPPERMDDVIYFDPGSIDRPMGLNMLEYDPAHPEQKTLVVDELFGIFKKGLMLF